MFISKQRLKRLKPGTVVRLTRFTMDEYEIVRVNAEMIGVISDTMDILTLNKFVRCIDSSEDLWNRGKLYQIDFWKDVEILKGSEAKRWLLLDKI